MTKQRAIILFFIKIVCVFAIVCVLAIAVQYISNLKRENELLHYVTKMATLFAEGNIPQATRYLDHLDLSGPRLPEEFQPLAKMISTANALRLFEEARINLNRGNLARAENSFEVGRFYLGDDDLSKVECPPWVRELDVKLKSLQKK